MGYGSSQDQNRATAFLINWKTKTKEKEKGKKQKERIERKYREMEDNLRQSLNKVATLKIDI